MRLVEERKAKEHLESQNQTTKNEIQVKPIVETKPPPPPAPASSSLIKMNNHDKGEDLLRYIKSKQSFPKNKTFSFLLFRFTPPPSDYQPKALSPNDLPAKLQQQMNGPIRKSTKAKW